MTFKDVLIYSVKPLLTSYLIIFIVLVGLFLLLIDRREMKDAGKKRDAKVAQIIGITYIILGPILYLIGKAI